MQTCEAGPPSLPWRWAPPTPPRGATLTCAPGAAVAPTLAGPAAERAGLGAGAPSTGARAGSPEHDLQRKTALCRRRRGCGTVWAWQRQARWVGVTHPLRPSLRPQPSAGAWRSPAPSARGEVAAPVEGSGAVRAPQHVRPVPAHAAPRAGRRALRDRQRGDLGPSALCRPLTPPGWTAGRGAPVGIQKVPRCGRQTVGPAILGSWPRGQGRPSTFGLQPGEMRCPDLTPPWWAKSPSGNRLSQNRREGLRDLGTSETQGPPGPLHCPASLRGGVGGGFRSKERICWSSSRMPSSLSSPTSCSGPAPHCTQQ